MYMVYLRSKGRVPQQSIATQNWQSQLVFDMSITNVVSVVGFGFFMFSLGNIIAFEHTCEQSHGTTFASRYLLEEENTL